MTNAVILAGLHVLAAVAAIARLPPLHPVGLWTLPWAFATTLFALHLLPYRALGDGTVALVVAASAAFCGAALLAARDAGDASTHASPARRERLGAPSVELAAALALVATFAGLALFLAELVWRFGLRDALVTAPEVRLAIGEGAASLTIKYLYAGYAAAALCGIAAGAASTSRGRAAWLALGAAAVAAQYFTTGRSNVVLAALVLGIAVALSMPRPPSRGRLLGAVGGVMLFALVVFTAGGAIIGKTLASNPLGVVASPLTEHSLLRPLALPYQYASAPIAGLDLQLAVAGETRDSLGCASFSLACAIAARAGVPVTPEPAIRPFTAPPLPWNTYTALDLPLLDGGPAFVVAFFALAGAAIGALWRLAQRGPPLAVGLYALYGPVLLYSIVQNNFLAAHVVGAALLLTALLWLAGHFGDRRATARLARALLLGRRSVGAR